MLTAGTVHGLRTLFEGQHRPVFAQMVQLQGEESPFSHLRVALTERPKTRRLAENRSQTLNSRGTHGTETLRRDKMNNHL
jgi:hypothetical protein